MPLYRSVDISLVSQFDLKTIPEFPCSSPSLDAPTRPTIDAHSPSPLTSDNTVTVYAPIYAGSQFWFRYHVQPPEDLFAPSRELFYYFKLSLDGKPVTSWGVGAEADYTGSVHFSLGQSAASTRAAAWEKRAFVFGRHDKPSEIEVRVYRSRARRLSGPPWEPILEPIEQDEDSDTDQTDTGPGKPKGVTLKNAGLTPPHHPLHYYRYALKDPLDEPYVNFRWLTRSWEQIESLDAIPTGFEARPASVKGAGDENSSSTSEWSSIEDDDDDGDEEERPGIAEEYVVGLFDDEQKSDDEQGNTLANEMTATNSNRTAVSKSTRMHSGNEILQHFDDDSTKSSSDSLARPTLSPLKRPRVVKPGRGIEAILHPQDRQIGSDAISSSISLPLAPSLGTISIMAPSTTSDRNIFGSTSAPPDVGYEASSSADRRASLPRGWVSPDWKSNWRSVPPSKSSRRGLDEQRNSLNSMQVKPTKRASGLSRTSSPTTSESHLEDTQSPGTMNRLQKVKGFFENALKKRSSNSDM